MERSDGEFSLNVCAMVKRRLLGEKLLEERPGADDVVFLIIENGTAHLRSGFACRECFCAH